VGGGPRSRRPAPVRLVALVFGSTSWILASGVIIWLATNGLVSALRPIIRLNRPQLPALLLVGEHSVHFGHELFGGQGGLVEDLRQELFRAWLARC
jgi:hypothetical protein